MNEGIVLVMRARDKKVLTKAPNRTKTSIIWKMCPKIRNKNVRLLQKQKRKALELKMVLGISGPAILFLKLT